MKRKKEDNGGGEKERPRGQDVMSMTLHSKGEICETKDFALKQT